jgi:hypothetical protein
MAELTRYQKEMINFADYIIKRNGSTEVRIFKDKFPYFGYFDDYKSIFNSISPVHRKKPGRIDYGDTPRDGEADAIYFLLNPVKQDYLAKCYNRIKQAKAGSTTPDEAITSIKLILIDADPVRSPSDISSTKSEKHAAAGVIRKIHKWLKKSGITTIPADSGNGFHLLVPVHHDDVSSAHKKVCIFLDYISKKYSTDKVSVDTVVSNPARITKLYGTMVCKGDNMPNRPHRRSALHFKKWMRELPDQPLFEATASEIDYTVTAPIATTTATKTGNTGSDQPDPESRAKHIEIIQHILKSKGFSHRESDKGARHIFEFESCPVHTDHDGHSFECCIIVEASGAFSGKCQHDKTKGWADFKEAIEYTKLKPKSDKIEITIGSSMPAEEKKVFTDDPLVIPIGYRNSTLLFYCADSKQYLEYLATDLHIEMLCSNMKYWEAYCPDAFTYNKDGKLIGVDNKMIKCQLIADCKATDRRIDFMEMRETGAYLDAGRIIWNAGNRVFVDCQETYYHLINSNCLYQASDHHKIVTEELTVSEFQRALEVLRKTTLETEADSWLLVCGIAAGYLSGCSPWNAHIWATGPKGSGKTELRDLVILVLIKAIGGICRDGSLTEAGIRQSLQKRASIFCHDEAEHSDHIKKELEMIRVASHGGEISRGTVSGKSLVFKVRTTFIMLSISDSVTAEADRERFIYISTRHSGDSSSNWGELKKELKDTFTDNFAAKMCFTMVKHAKEFIVMHNYVREKFIAYAKAGGTTTQSISRYADLYASPISAMFILTGFYAPSDIDQAYMDSIFESLRKCGKLSGIHYETAEDSGDTSINIYNQFLDTQLQVEDLSDGRSSKKTIREVLDNDIDQLKICLRKYGIYWIPDKNCMRLKLRSVYLIEIFKSFGYQNYKKMLLGVPGAKEGRAKKFGKEVLKGIEIPYPLPQDGEVVSESLIDIIGEAR